MIKKARPIRMYQLVDENGENAGVIKTSYPLVRFHHILKHNEFKDVEELRNAIIRKGYSAFTNL